ncbi:MAG: DUF1566 domain-containing protein [Verrucomicrobiae bacterium]|nr:DUF1566 domain-containing protein [Verrucomicrobiae bacterium]
MKRILFCLAAPLLLLGFRPPASLAQTNVAPTVEVLSAAMRPGTTLMDIFFRVNDPDDATVKVRALAFKDGSRNFANVIRPVTFVEGTATNLGDAITTGVDHKLTWDIRSDWNIELAQVKFEVLCRDSRGLVPISWTTIPATSNTTALTISTTVPSSTEVLNALFWMYADRDPWLSASNGYLRGTAASGIFSNEWLVSGSSPQLDAATVFLYKKMNIARASFAEKDFAISARSSITDRYALINAVERPWNESMLGSDPRATTSTPMSSRWVQHTYAGGAVTMSDRYTGLMWCYYADELHRHTLLDEYSAVNMTHNDALTSCAEYYYAGYDDWRLPSLSQLHPMYSYRAYFSGVQYKFWSSSYDPPSYPWAVDMSTGSALWWNPGYAEYVWPMRGGN